MAQIQQKKLGSKTAQRRWMNVIVYAFLIIGGVTMLLPLWWMFISSIKTKSAFLMTRVSLGIPMGADRQWNNYVRVWQMIPLARGLINTLCIAVPVVFIGTLTSSMSAFSFSKLRFPGKDRLFLAILGTMMIPFAIIMIPQFIMYSKIGWLDTWYPLMIPGMLGNVSMIFFLRQYMNGIPTSMIESARIDGAGYPLIYWKMMLPNAMPAISAQAILWFMGAWNDYFAPSIYLNTDTKKTIQVLIQSLNAMYAIQTDYPVILAGSVISLLPVLILFMIFQKQIIASVAMTGLK